MAERSADKVTVGVNSDAAEDLAALMETDWFEREKDAYLVAISTAIARGLEVSTGSIPGTTTKFNVGTLDSDGIVKQLVRSLLSDEEDPYDLSERLAHVGLAYLKTRLVDRGFTLSEVLYPDPEADDG